MGLMGQIPITSTLAHVDITGCGIPASSTMVVGRYDLKPV